MTFSFIQRVFLSRILSLSILWSSLLLSGRVLTRAIFSTLYSTLFSRPWLIKHLLPTSILFSFIAVFPITSYSEEPQIPPASASQPKSVSEKNTPQTDGSQEEKNTVLEIMPRLPLADLKAFANVFSQIRASYVEEIDDTTLLENAIKGMLSGLDPHSAYLDANSFNSLRNNTSGEFGGLGLEVGMENGFIKVISPIDGTPAEKADMKAGDLIIKLENKPVKGLSLSEAVDIMRGPRGSEITITVVRDGISKPFDVTLTRDTVQIVSVRSRLLEPHFGYIRIAQFQNNTGQDVVKAVNKLKVESGQQLKGLVLDLRNNPGGVLKASVDVADAFLDGGLIVYTEGRIISSLNKFNANLKDFTDNIPLVVLINGGSASASEIVAGALQDHRRAIIMGTDSFGKGSVQTVIPLSEDKAIKLTTALYFTPNGRSIQAQGIKPDIVVEPARLTTLKKRHQISEADLSGHLEINNSDSSKNQPSDNKPASNNTFTAPPKGQELLARDNQLFEALNLLKGISILNPLPQPAITAKAETTNAAPENKTLTPSGV